MEQAIRICGVFSYHTVLVDQARGLARNLQGRGYLKHQTLDLSFTNSEVLRSFSFVIIGNPPPAAAGPPSRQFAFVVKTRKRGDVDACAVRSVMRCKAMAILGNTSCSRTYEATLTTEYGQSFTSDCCISDTTK